MRVDALDVVERRLLTGMGDRLRWRATDQQYRFADRLSSERQIARGVFSIRLIEKERGGRSAQCRGVAVEQLDGVRGSGGMNAAEAADPVPPTTPAARQMLGSCNCNEAAKPFGVMPRA